MTALAISSGRAISSTSEMRSISLVPPPWDGGMKLPSRGVSTPPGQTALMRTPRRPNSTARARVSMITAPFDAQYAAEKGWPLTPAIEPMLQTAPPDSSR